MLVCGEELQQEHADATAYIDDMGDGAPVVLLGDLLCVPSYLRRHERVERSRAAGPRELRVEPALVAARRARADAFEQPRPRLGPHARRAIEVEPGSGADLVDEQSREIGVRVRTVVLREDTAGDQVPQQPPESIGIRSRSLGQVVQPGRARLEVVGKPQRRGDPQSPGRCEVAQLPEPCLHLLGAHAALCDAGCRHEPSTPGVTLSALRSTHSYGHHSSQIGELFLPGGGASHPVAVVIHGGYWRARYDRSLMTDLCLDLVEHGWAAWNLEYRRVGDGGGWPETFLDVASGVDALADLGAPLDLERVAAIGHSAGGQLALWAAARPTLPTGAPGAEPGVRVGAVVSQAGVADLRLAADLTPSDEPTRALLGDPAVNAEAYELASPRERLPLGVPQLLLHGDRDDTVSMRIWESYAAGVRAAGDPCDLVVLPGAGHFEHIDPRSDAWRISRDWLDRYASAPRS